MAAEHSDDLDLLLDSALDDFQTLNLTPSTKRSEDGAEKKRESTSLPSGVQGLGMGLPDLKAKKKGKQKVSKDCHVSEALDKLMEQTKETVIGLESAAPAAKLGGGDMANEAMIEDWIKQFEELAGPQDMESIVETMMQQLLSKEILQEPMKEIGERYPKWLEKHSATLSTEDYQRYSHQYELITNLNEVYEKEPNNFTKVVDLMQKMQECGQPPNDIVEELAPDFDLSMLSQMSQGAQDGQANCCVM